MKAEKRAELQALLNQLTYGIEIEQVGLGRYSSETHQVLNQINAQFQGREQWKVVSDGSIRGHGSEFVSGIMSHSSIEKTQEAVRMIRRGGGREDNSCGIHVHVDGSRFLRNPKALVRLVKIVNRYEDLMFHALKADALTEGQDRSVERRPCGGIGWSRPVCQDFLNRVSALKNPTIDQIKTEWYRSEGGSPYSRYDRSRYRLLNLHALFTKGTIEFRCFNSTLHAGKIKAYIQLSMMICAQALLLSSAQKGKRVFNLEKGYFQVRTWLIKLGAVGNEYKTMRHHLCNHLQGSPSFYN